MKLVAPAQDLTEDIVKGQKISQLEGEYDVTSYRSTTSAAKPNVAELDVSKNIDKLDLTGGEEMEAVRIVLLLVHLQHPPVRVTLDAEDERLIYIYGCPIPSLSSCALAHIVDNAPSLDKLQLMVDLHMESLVSAVALEDDLRNILGINRYLSHHKHLSFPIAKLLPRKLHL